MGADLAAPDPADDGVNFGEGVEESPFDAGRCRAGFCQ